MGDLRDYLCPLIRSVPTSAPAALPTHCWHCVFEPLCEHLENRTLRRAHLYGSGSLYFKESQGLRSSLAPPSPPPRSRRLLRSLLRRNKTDQLHGAKPIEGEDTYRDILASCRGCLGAYLSTVIMSNNNDAAVVLGKRLADNRGCLAGLLFIRAKVQNHRLIFLLVHLLLKISL